MEDVGEIHLAGFSEEHAGRGKRLLVDDHGSAVRPDVWSLYRYALSRTKAVPTLIEWDNNVPEWSYGDDFPRFIDQFAPAEDVPYLSDVARLEIAWSRR